MKKIGLVGGISWVSTIDYYRFINEGINEKLGGLDYAECIIYSLNFGDIHRRTWVNSYELLLKACESLKLSKVDAIVLCCNTAHLFADDLQKKIELPILHIVSATAKQIKKQGLRTVGLLGTQFTMEMDFYKKQLRENNIVTLIPEPQKTRDYIQYTLKEELGKGIVKAETKSAYISIINELIENGAEGIVFGCTEIPLMLTQADVNVPVFDTTKIHAEAAVEFVISGN